MIRRLAAFGGYALFWMFFFFAARLFFIFAQYRQAASYDPGLLTQTFYYGTKLDISATAYLFLIPVLAAIPSLFIKRVWYGNFLRFYTGFFIVIAAVIVAVDAVLYRYWGFRMDYTPFIYLKTPGDAAASASTTELIIIPLMILLLSALFIYLYNKYLNRFFEDHGKVRHPVPSALFTLVLLAALIIPIRGGFGVAPVNAGSVYFSEKPFVNHAAINVFWNVGHSAFVGKASVNPYNYGNIDSSRMLVGELLSGNDEPVKVLNNERPNILIIVMESFGDSMIGTLGGDSLTTPFFNSLSREGILFENLYASGPRTDKAMPAILNGYPAQPATSIIKEPEKTQSLPGIVKIFADSGYSTSFWYGGDIDFANFNSFILNSGFREVITKDNFSPAHYNSKWGVHDNVLLEALADSMKNESGPFFRVVLTLSSHEPFEIPIDPVFKGDDDLTAFKNSIWYADRSIGNFIKAARQMPWWKNTLVILVGDHCRRNGADEPAYSEQIFRIPMLWTGGAVAPKGLRISKYASQTDIPSTLMHQLGIRTTFQFGKDLFSESSKSFAFYTFNEGFGFITDTSACIYDHKMKAPVVERGNGSRKAEAYGKALLQVLYDDYLKR
jgi:phosphoglycerol transferase MdoB-like AlkP superfamily enzyme